MKTHTITGGGGIRLHAVEAGNAQGRPILFLHGTSQCWLQWKRQFESTLADDFRLIALDLRGHGLSEKPRDAYGESKLWADDVNAVIQSLQLRNVVLSGWSYGPLVILDYIRHYGEGNLGGVQFIGGLTKLGSEDAMSVLTPEVAVVFPQLMSTDADSSVCGLQGLLRLCFAHELSTTDFYTMLGYNVSVPAHVRQGLFSRSLNNDDVMARMRKPVLITQGAADAIVKMDAVEKQRTAMPHAKVNIIEGAGHAAFWDAPAGFNESLRAFCSLPS